MLSSSNSEACAIVPAVKLLLHANKKLRVRDAAAAAAREEATENKNIFVFLLSSCVFASRAAMDAILNTSIMTQVR